MSHLRPAGDEAAARGPAAAQPPRSRRAVRLRAAPGRRGGRPGLRAAARRPDRRRRRSRAPGARCRAPAPATTPTWAGWWSTRSGVASVAQTLTDLAPAARLRPAAGRGAGARHRARARLPAGRHLRAHRRGPPAGAPGDRPRDRGRRRPRRGPRRPRRRAELLHAIDWHHGPPAGPAAGRGEPRGAGAVAGEPARDVGQIAPRGTRDGRNRGIERRQGGKTPRWSGRDRAGCGIRLRRSASDEVS